ncbi:MAG: TIGR00159 family protein [Ruminococcaceae bacterium]|nr:TIGR00159 family protein [Oscillospiraceae bacterium]
MLRNVIMPFNLLEITFQFRYIKNLWSSIVDYFNQIKGLFGTFGFIDFIDILFVAIVLYVIIRIIRETRAMQLVKGIVFFVLLYVVINFLGMSASSYIFKEIFSNVLIILIILFGPEIRNILEQMGKGAARNSLKTILHSGVAIEVAGIKKAIDAVCKACTDMSDDKIGALIVFENDTLLGDVISSGTIIDAAPSKELIENIFFPKSPLHDGAMIIRGSQVYAAGCILPLTRDNVSSSLGTRHRAAIGITQESDAIVVVVSEETGAISIADNGTLNRDISTGELRDILERQFIPSGSKSDEKILSKLVRRIKK